jgi:membrane protein CcdC involved in cytochrome C biogenesis
VFDIISGVMLLFVSFAYIFVGKKFFKYANQVTISGYQSIKKRGKATIVILSCLFIVRVVFNILRGALQFDKKWNENAFKDDDVSYGVYYFFYVVILDLLPKAYLLYSAGTAINKNLDKDNRHGLVSGG